MTRDRIAEVTALLKAARVHAVAHRTAEPLWRQVYGLVAPHVPAEDRELVALAAEAYLGSFGEEVFHPSLR